MYCTAPLSRRKGRLRSFYDDDDDDDDDYWLCVKECNEFRTVLPVWSAHSHAAPLLHRLHWLPVHRRITYKLCVFMFDVYHGTAPKYLTELCSCCNDHRLLSSTRGDFVVRQTRTRLADSSFTIAGPAAWNSLPACIRSINSHDSFCRQLKTYLFSLPCLNCIV